MKKNITALSCCLLLCFFAGCTKNENTFPDIQDLSVKWELLENNYKGTGAFRSLVHITNKSKTKVLGNKGWELYFNFTPSSRIMMDSIPASVKLMHLNGNLFKIIPTESFPLLKNGETYSLPLIGSFVAIKYSDAPGGFYFITDEAPERPMEVKNFSIAPIRNDQVKRNDQDHLEVPTALSRYEANSQLSLMAEKEVPKIIPTPQQISYGNKLVELNSDYVIGYESNLRSEAEYLQRALKTLMGKELPLREGEVKTQKTILLRTETLAFNVSPEAYQLSVSDKGIEIKGNDPAGVFYGIQSLRALFPLNAYHEKSETLSLRECLVKDAPLFPYRGILLDVVRHFHNKESVLKYLELLSFYKINKFHFHLTDDEGWRVEIRNLPELTEIAGKRGHTLTEQDQLSPSYGDGPFGSPMSNGYYSREDFIEILKYAHTRHIEIIPEIDLPGHARAAIKAMDVRYNRYMVKGDTAEAVKFLLRDLNDSSVYRSVQLYNDNVVCPCQEGIYNFIKEVTGELKSMYNEAGVPFQTLHMGGDEVAEGAWEKSPSCDKLRASNENIRSAHQIKDYFFRRANEIITAFKLSPAVVEDMAFYRSTENGKTELKITEEFSNKGIKTYAWCNTWGWGMEDMGYRLANAGYPVVLCPVTNIYFDLAYTNEPEEPGLCWGGFNDTRKAYEYTPLNIYNSAYNDLNGDPVNMEQMKTKERLTDKGRKNIIGIQAMLFSETLKSKEMLEYYTFPKLIGLAERAWSKQPDWAMVENREKRLVLLEKDWNIFVNAIGQRELVRLDYLAGGVAYRLPLPGVKQEGEMVKANVAFPGLKIRYTTDGSDPVSTSAEYKEPLNLKGTLKFASFSSTGRSSRVSVMERSK